LKTMSLAAASVLLGLAAAPAFGADYDTTEKSPLYELHLRVPAVAMTIAPLKEKILALYKADADQAKGDAKEDKQDNPSFHPYSIDTVWRVTFESDAVLSLSADTNADTGGAHPNEGFQTLVWDKRANRPVPVEALFAPDQVKTALGAIADAATKAWTRTYVQRSGQQPGPEADVAKDGIGADADKLKNYALTYAKGQTTANGIVLLYGAGQAWPHVLGDFRLAVPASVFAKYLAPQWKTVFGAN
jgi:Deacetylase PdaC